MGNKQQATARAPAAKQVTGQRKAKKTTSTLKRVSARQKKAVSTLIDETDEYINPGNPNETTDISIGDVLMELPPRNQSAHANMAIDEDFESWDNSLEVEEDVRGKAKDDSLDTFDICFEVPYKNASCDIIIPSDVNFGAFLTRIAQRMDVSITHLSQIGYVLPWNKPKSGKPIPKLVEDEASFQLLISNVCQHIEEQKARYQGKGIVKPFSITLVDMSNPGGEKGNIRKKTALQPVAAAPEMDEHDQQCKLIALIEEQHKCEEHGKACFVQSNGAHYQYTMEDLTIWASLLDRRLATIDTPPDRLNLAEKCSHQAVIKCRAATTTPATGDASALGPSNDGMPQWAQMLVAMIGGFGVAARTNYSHHAPHISYHADRSPSQSPLLAPRKRTSSNDSLELEYPEFRPWLEIIENDMSRNKHSEKFSQSATSLVDNHKLFTLEDIISISAQDIATYGMMEFGTASCILRFAREDVNMLKMKRKKVRQ